jgi:hypothetical protein
VVGGEVSLTLLLLGRCLLWRTSENTSSAHFGE